MRSLLVIMITMAIRGVYLTTNVPVLQKYQTLTQNIFLLADWGGLVSEL